MLGIDPCTCIMAKHMTKEEWARIRTKGLARYFISSGVLKVGIICGFLFALFPYELGIATHAYSMSGMMFILLTVVLTLVFTVGLGCLFWHLNEKGFHSGGPGPDLAILSSRSITKAEFRDIDRKMLRRQLRRRLLALPLVVFFFAALGLVPHSFPHRHLYVWIITIIGVIYFVFLMRFVNRGTRADSEEFGAICPNCNKSLYLGQGVKNGCCPNCGYQLFDDAVA